MGVLRSGSAASLGRGAPEDVEQRELGQAGDAAPAAKWGCRAGGAQPSTRGGCRARSSALEGCGHGCRVPVSPCPRVLPQGTALLQCGVTVRVTPVSREEGGDRDGRHGGRAGEGAAGTGAL